MSFFSVSKVSLTRHKKGMKITTAIYCLALILTMLSTMTALTLTNHLHRVYSTDYMYRMVDISYHPDFNKEYSPEEIYQWLSSIEHVELITHFTSSQALYIKEMDAKPTWVGGAFEGTPHYEGAPLTLVAGRAPEPGETNVVLAPSHISNNYLTGSGDGLLREEKELIRGESLLGSDMILLYGDGEEKTPYPCRVIGVYDSFAMGMNACQIFLPQEELDKINKEMGNPVSQIPYVLVDNYKNLPAVEAEIEQKGFYYDRIKIPGGIADITPAILAFGLLAGGVALLIGALAVSITAAGAIRERTKEIGMLKAMGYQNRHIRRILLLENARTCLWAMGISFVVCCILFFGAWYLIRPFLTTLFIGISFSPLLFLAVFAAASLAILLFSLLAGLLAAARVYDISPAVAVRDEE